MERIAIIDHDNHTLFVEDIDEDILQERYNGSEENYIEDNYYIGSYSWDYVTDAEYIPASPYKDQIEINFEELI